MMRIKHESNIMKGVDMQNTIIELSRQNEQDAEGVYLAVDIQNKIRETANIIDSTRVDEWVSVLTSLRQGEFVAVGPVEVGDRVSKIPLKINGWIE